MSSNIEYVQSAILSQETREPGSHELPVSKSEFKLPGIKHSSSSVYLKPYDRLYYDSKNFHRYGKINGLLSEVAASVAEPVKTREAGDKRALQPIKNPRKIPMRDFIGRPVSREK
jgi:hypothetical protein